MHAIANIMRRPVVLLSAKDTWERALAGVSATLPHESMHTLHHTPSSHAYLLLGSFCTTSGTGVPASSRRCASIRRRAKEGSSGCGQQLGSATGALRMPRLLLYSCVSIDCARVTRGLRSEGRHGEAQSRGADP
jgi:hypothetical protein